MAMDLGMLMLLRGKEIDRSTLNQMVATANDKRRKIFMKIADLLFGLIMFFWSDLKFTDSAGKEFDPTKDGVDPTTKMNAIISAMQSSNKNTLLREFLRPLIVDAAEVIAGLMEPDQMVLSMMAGQQQGSGYAANGQYYAPPPGGYAGGAPVVNVHPPIAARADVGPQVNPIAAQYEGQLIKDPQDPRVFHIYGGQRHWVTTEAAFNRRQYNGNSINRNVPISVIMQIPAGADEY